MADVFVIAGNKKSWMFIGFFCVMVGFVDEKGGSYRMSAEIKMQLIDLCHFAAIFCNLIDYVGVKVQRKLANILVFQCRLVKVFF